MRGNTGLIKVSDIKTMVTLPAYILDDERVSLSAKGLYVQICFSKNDILSLSDITTLANNTEEEITQYINELIDKGYLDYKNSTYSLKQKPITSKTIEKRNIKEVKESIKEAEITPVVKKNKFDFIRDRVNASDFSTSVKVLLIDYFIKWLKGEDRFEGQVLHKNMVDGRIESLRSIREEFHLNQTELEKCVKQSIENHWFKFVWPLAEKPNSNFDKNVLTSGSYSSEEIEEIKRKAEKKLEAYK